MPLAWSVQPIDLVTGDVATGESGEPRRTARAGYGPLLQRDHWARIARCELRPSQFGELLARRFWDFSPPGLADFRRVDGTTKPLEVGDDVEVDILFTGRRLVQVLHRNDNSLTFATLAGHPEAGRITFGAYRHDCGDVIFHVRSRARSSKRSIYAGFLAVGSSMQSNTWAGLIERIASATGAGVVDFVYEETIECEDDEDDEACGPTFIAKGD